MLRYHLDDLGWFQFESLVQSLLKAKFAVGIESWGGPGDYGRDAYFDGPLRYPSADVHDGPFLFQVKFVQGANSAGAAPRQPLLDAVRAESSRIQRRIANRTWPGHCHYVLLTNAAPSPTLRTTLRQVLLDSASGMDVHIHGGTDICDFLDDQPELRKAFPQLLSIRDLEDLLSRTVQRDIINRSRLALDSAADYPPVFVPTSAYDRTWRVLQKHHFAVLEGPPEMGKTAIAWMVGLVNLSNGRDVIICDKPDAFFRSLDPARPQVFVADDAFGRTEYEPARGRYWEQDLDRVLRALDAQHWLIWTSRKHILQRALRDLDLQGRAAPFPSPAAVLVDASNLELHEKALILYRHAKSSNLRSEEVALVKQYAPFVVHHRSFTPERIRRFVTQRLPDCVSVLASSGADGVRKEIDDAIHNPTDRMRKTFRALPSAHKWVLGGLLECGRRATETAVQRAYEAHCPLRRRQPFGDIADQLTESFLNRREVDHIKFMTWVHPSCRDLVIDELGSDPDYCQDFLRSCSPSGLILAISEAGGPTGHRRLPLMASPESWNILQQRVGDLIRQSSTEECSEMLTSMSDVFESADHDETREQLVCLLATACRSAREKWDSSQSVLNGEQFRAYGHASTHLDVLPQLPDLRASWSHADRRFEAELHRNAHSPLNTEELAAWSDFVSAVAAMEPRFLLQHRFPADYDDGNRETI